MQKLVGFALVWMAVSVFAMEGIAANRRASFAPREIT
jgi:EamA domain-containing membrane protein RarD